MIRQVYAKALSLLLILSIFSLPGLGFPVSVQQEPTTTLYVDPQIGTANVNQTYTVTVWLLDVTDLYGLDVRFAWGSAVLQYNITYFHTMGEWGDAVLWDPIILTERLDATGGTYQATAVSRSGTPFTGTGVVFHMEFTVRQTGETPLYFTYTALSNPQGGDIPHQAQDGYFEMPGLGDIPTADFTSSPSLPVINRTAVMFDASTSSDPDGGGIAQYIWNWGDNSPLQSTTNPTITHTYVAPGVQPSWEYTVKLTVVDVEGSQSKTTSKSVTIVYPSPVAKFATWPQFNIKREVYAVINKNITFDASESYDPDLEAGDPTGGIVQYKWDWGTWKYGEINQTFTSEPITSRSYTYKQPEGFKVSLVVRDTEGLESPSSLEVTVYVIDARDTEVTSIQITPAQIGVGQNATIRATISNLGNVAESFIATAYYNQTALGPSVQWVKIKEQNVASLQPLQSMEVTYTWNTQGLSPNQYYVMVNTTDVPHETNSANNARISDSPIRLTEAPPTATFSYSPSSPLPWETVSFDASSSAPNGGTITGYTWDFGDGNIDTGVSVTHVYGALGTYNVILNVTDSEGYWDIESKLVQVVYSRTIMHEFTVGATSFNITITSNSTVFNIGLDPAQRKISFNVTGPTGTTGFANVTVPLYAMWGPWTILLDDGLPLNSSETSNATHTILYLTYIHSTHEVVLISTGIVSEFPFVLALLMILAVATIAGAIAGRKRLFKRRNRQAS